MERGLHRHAANLFVPRAAALWRLDCLGVRRAALPNRADGHGAIQQAAILGRLRGANGARDRHQGRSEKAAPADEMLDEKVAPELAASTAYQPAYSQEEIDYIEYMIKPME